MPTRPYNPKFEQTEELAKLEIAPRTGTRDRAPALFL
jgi:hypothetical protein